MRGWGAGRLTFNVDNLLERSVGRTGLLVHIGGGDSSGLQNRLVTEDSSALGSLAQFQVGAVRWLPNGMSVQSIAYEQLPIGDQKTHAAAGRFGARSTSVSGYKVNEDNGFNTTLSAPVSEHLMFTGSYNRSLRLHLDTVSLGFTWMWRGFGRRSDSLVEKAMQEAERGDAGRVAYPPER